MEMAKLPFTQGVEMEVQVVDEKGRLLQGGRLVRVWDHLMKNAANILQKTVSREKGLDFTSKILGVTLKEKERRGRRLPYVVVSYKTDKGRIEVDVFGPDPNVSQITWILELVTPPCESMEELSWWIKTLYKVAFAALPRGYNLISIGFNPLEEEYRSGVTFGDHYHIGVNDGKEKAAVYNMIRAFIPHLIALTVNSPFMNGKPTGVVRVRRRGRTSIIGRDCVRDLRLKYNTGQTGPADKDHYVPYLEVLNRKTFDETVMREPPDDRYVDVFPFTEYGTIEVRVFDAQFSVARRLAVAALLQALALKAVKIVRKGGKIPNVSSATLVENREKAVLYGLLGKFFPDRGLEKHDRGFAEKYNINPAGKPNSKLFEAAQGMIEFIREEINELGYWDYLKPVLVSVYGSSRVEPPCAPADFLLYLYDASASRIDRTISHLMEMTRKYCIGDGDPLVAAFGEAEEFEVAERRKAAVNVKAMASVTATRVVAGERIPFTLEVTGSAPVKGTLIAKVVLEGGAVLRTAVKRVEIPGNGVLKVTGGQLPLEVPFAAFQGKRRCRLKFILKDEVRNELCEVETKTFTAIATPIIRILPVSIPKKIVERRRGEIKLRVEAQTAEFKGRYQVRAYLREGDKAKLLAAKHVSFPTTLTLSLPAARAGEYTVKVQVFYREKLVAEYESSPIIVQEEKTERKAKIERRGVPVAKEEARLIRVVVPVKEREERREVEKAKPQVTVRREEPARVRGAGKEARATVKRRQGRVEERRLLTVPEPAQAVPPFRVKSKGRVRVSRALDVSHVALKPKVALDEKVSKSRVQWGETCRVVFNVRNLNPDLPGPFWVRVLVVDSEVKQLDHREIVVHDSRRLTYKVKAGRDVKAGKFRVRCEILYDGVVVAQGQTRIIEVAPLSARKTVKVLGVEAPKAIVPVDAAVFKVRVEVRGVITPVRVSLTAATSKSSSVQEYSLTNGRYVLPISIGTEGVKGEEAAVNLKVKVENVKVYERKLTIPVLPEPPVNVHGLTIQKASVQAGENVKYHLRLRNVGDGRVRVRGEVRVCSLTGEGGKEGFSMVIEPKGREDVYGEIEVPPWLVEEKIYLLATLSYKGKEANYVQQRATQTVDVTPPLRPLVKVKVRDAAIPTLTREGDKIKVNLLVEKRIKETVRIRLVAESPLGVKEIWSGKIKDEKKDIGPIEWIAPSVPYRMEFDLKAKVDINKRELPPNIIDAFSKKVIIVKRRK